MVKNRDGFVVTLETIKSVEDGGESWRITKDDGWTFGVSKSDLGYEPKVGDTVLMSQAVNTVAGIVIEGHVARWWDKAKVDADHEQWQKNYRLEKLERYIEHGDALKERVKVLPKPLRERMERFAAEGGVDFWIDDASYEMHALEGAAALLRKVKELGLIQSVDQPTLTAGGTAEAIGWINGWWDLNSEKHNYDYKKQKEEVPDFGDGHSGWTASAAKGLAVAILEGKDI